MAWQTIEQRIAGATRKAASIRLVLRGESSRPACIVSFRKDFAASIAWKAGEPVGLQVGDGDHAGRIRIVRLKKGAASEIATVRRMQKGGMTFDLGHIPQLGIEPHDKAATDAQAIDADTIELNIPEWDDAAQAAGDDDEQEQIPRDPPRARQPARVNGTTVLTKYGITIDLEHDAESIAFNKKTMDLTTRQAAVVATLLRAYPQFVNRPFILKNALADVPHHTQDASLDLIVGDLAKALAGIGLQLKNQKGVGLALAIGD